MLGQTEYTIQGFFKMEDKIPCIDCICIPICKFRSFTSLNRQCILIRKFFKELEWQIPRHSYRFLHIHEIHKTYEIKKESGPGCIWIQRNYDDQTRSFYIY